MQGIFHDRLVARFVARSYQTADAVVCLSRATLEQVRRRFPDIAPRLILNAVDTEFFRPPEARPPLAGRVARLIFVGNLIRRKGVDLIAPIMAQLGNRFEIHYTSGLRTNEDPLSHIPNATNLGRLDQESMREAYRAADLLLLPSRLEGLPRAVMEAQACGVPAIVSDASSLPEAIVDGVTGHVCRAGDVESYTKAIRTAVAVQDRYDAMSVAARKFVLERHDLGRMVDEYVALCHALLEKS